MQLRRIFNSFSFAVLFSTTAIYLASSGSKADAASSDSASVDKESKKKASVYVHNDKRVTITHKSGLIETRIGGSMAWRNNNPSNIMYSKLAKKFGAIGRNGRWAVFPDYETGQAASIALLKSKKYINLTIDEAIARRTPPNENNTPGAQATVRKYSGFTGQEKISDLSEGQMRRLVAAIQKQEGWKSGSVVTNSSKVLSNNSAAPNS